MTCLMIGYPRLLRTTLKLNYRSHPALVRMPSQIFYEDNMRAAPIQRDNNNHPPPGRPVCYWQGVGFSHNFRGDDTSTSKAEKT